MSRTRCPLTDCEPWNWRVQVRRKNCYVSETFRRRKDGEDWASTWSATSTAVDHQRHYARCSRSWHWSLGRRDSIGAICD